VDKLLGILTVILGGTPTTADKQVDAARKAA